MRVLHIVQGLNFGRGLDSFLLDVFRSLDRARVTFDVCHLDDQPGSLMEDARRAGVAVWKCTPPDARGFAARFRRELEVRGPFDAVHAHLGHASGVLLRAAEKAGVGRRIAHYHATVEDVRPGWRRRLLLGWARRTTLTSATHVVGSSWAALRCNFPARWRDEPRMTVARYGVPPERFASTTAGPDDVRRELCIPAGAPVVGHVGRFIRRKNHRRLMESARLVADRKPDVKFVLVGDGPLLPEVMGRAAALDLNANVVFTGMRRDASRLYAAMDVFVLPSLAESHPLTLIEASMAGLPIVAANFPSAVECVAEALHPFLRAPTDPRGLADAILQLLSRAGDRSLCSAAREFGNRFALRAACETLLSLWGDPAAAPPPDPSDWVRTANLPEPNWSAAYSTR